MAGFRRAGPGDVALVTALTRDAYAPWVPLLGREPMPMTVDYAVAVQSHRIDLLDMGYGAVALIEMVGQADHLLIENVAVDPKCQRSGLGRRLMDHAEAVAKEMGLAEIRLFTNALFAVNLAFYQRLGYLETGRKPFRGGTTVYFTKTV